MKIIAKRISQSNYTKVAVPIMIMLIVGIYFYFFSTNAIGKSQALKENSVVATTTTTTKSNNKQYQEQEKTTSLKQEATILEVSKSLEQSLLTKDLPLDKTDKLVNDVVTVPQIKTIPTEQTQPKSFIAQITQPSSRGTSSQKQPEIKALVKEPSAPAPSKLEEPKLETTQSEPEAPKAKPELTKDSNNKETVNSELFKQDLNSYVIDIIKTYEIGKYPYLLNNDYTNYNGVTTNIVYQGNTIAKANPSGDRASHCVGITFEVFFKAMQERNKKLAISPEDFNGMNGADLRNFMLNWFVSDGVKPQQNCSVAIERYGLGKRIYNLEEAKSGDFIDISRENNTGHTAVFLNWIRKDGKIVGLKYWGSQSSTKGIAYKEEYFNITDSTGNKYGNVMFDQIYIGRVGAVEDYKDFK